MGCNCYLERGWPRRRHLAVMVIAWETSDNWDIPCEAQRGNQEARWAILAVRAKDPLADLGLDRQRSWNGISPHCSFVIYSVYCEFIWHWFCYVSIRTNLILAAWWYSLKPSLAASIFSCLRHLARLFWNQTWNITHNDNLSLFNRNNDINDKTSIHLL